MWDLESRLRQSLLASARSSAVLMLNSSHSLPGEIRSRRDFKVRARCCSDRSPADIDFWIFEMARCGMRNGKPTIPPLSANTARAIDPEERASFRSVLDETK